MWACQPRGRPQSDLRVMSCLHKAKDIFSVSGREDSLTCNLPPAKSRIPLSHSYFSIDIFMSSQAGVDARNFGI